MPALFKTMLQSLIIDYYDREIIQPRQALRTVIAAIIAFAMIFILPWPRTEWVLFTAVFLIQARLGNTLAQCLRFVLVTSLLALLGISIAALIADHIILLMILFFITTFFTVYVGIYGIEYGYAAFYINLYFLMGSNVNFTLGINWMVLPNIVVGELIVFAIILVLWPPNLEKDLKIRTRSSLILLKKFFLQTIQCFSDARHYEFRCVRCRNRLVRIFSKISQALQLLSAKKSHTPYRAIYADQQKLYQLLVAIGLYRYRILRPALAKAVAAGYAPFFEAVNQYLQLIILNENLELARNQLHPILLSCSVQDPLITNIERKAVQGFYTLLNELATFLKYFK